MGVRTRKVILTLALSLAATISTSAFAGWQDQASPADIERLQQLPQIREAAIADAQHGEGRGDWHAIPRVLQPQGRAVPANALVGD